MSTLGQGASGGYDQNQMQNVLDKIDELYHREGNTDVTGVPSGFTDLDKMTSGLQAGDLVIVAGRPSMGKTSLAMNIAEHVAIEQGLPVAVFSMEMGAVQLAMRMLGSVGRLDQTRLRTGRLNDEDWPRLTHAIQKMNGAQIYIDETPGLNSMELRARSRRLARTCGTLGLVIVDYLQLMSANSAGENRATEISEISRNLKGLAKELNCPVIALSQLNRSLEQRPNKRPVMSDLRESGAIEQDADMVLFLYRPEYYGLDQDENGNPTAGIGEVIIAKHRNGETGTVPLRFIGKYVKFADLEDGFNGSPSKENGADPFSSLAPSAQFESITLKPKNWDNEDEDPPF